MYYGKRLLILTALGTAALGAALHFLYQAVPNAASALISPINESLWEHVKIIYWPYLLAAAWLNRDRPGGIRPWLLTVPLLCGLMLLLGFGYHILLGGDAMWVDLLIYCLTMAAGFWLPTQFSGPFHGFKWVIPIILTILLGGAIAFFTLWPPHTILFLDLSTAGAWYPMIC